MEKREIKFRAWHITNEAMHPYVHVLSDLNEMICRDTYVVMQYTGLKDKKGTEIYEGDIVKTDFSKSYNEGYDSIQVIEFYEGSFGSRHKNDHFRIPALFSGRATQGMNLNYYEVIGNIYQNPELLKP